jgi:hypothetical protein
LNSSFGRAARFGLPVVAALAVGAGAGLAVGHHSTSTASAGNAAVAFAGPNGFRGGVAGEQHIQGTVSAKTATTVTVKSSGGTTATYTVNATTEIVRDGRAATLSAVAVGEPVLVHVYPSSSGRMLVERLFAGSSATDVAPGLVGPRGAGLGSGSAGTLTIT